MGGGRELTKSGGSLPPQVLCDRVVSHLTEQGVMASVNLARVADLIRGFAATLRPPEFARPAPCTTVNRILEPRWARPCVVGSATANARPATQCNVLLVSLQL